MDLAPHFSYTGIQTQTNPFPNKQLFIVFLIFKVMHNRQQTGLCAFILKANGTRFFFFHLIVKTTTTKEILRKATSCCRFCKINSQNSNIREMSYTFILKEKIINKQYEPQEAISLVGRGRNKKTAVRLGTKKPIFFASIVLLHAV